MTGPTSSKTQTFSVPSDAAGTRLDLFLVSQLPEVSRSRLQLLIKSGRVHVNGHPAKSSQVVDAGATIVLTGSAEPPPLKAVAEDIPLSVVFEDASFAVIDKPAGMMVHAGAGTAAEEDEAPDPRTRGTLVNALLHHFKALSSEGGDLRPGIVHRLDKETSGLIVVAKNDASHRKLAEQFAERQVKKTYVALVHGWPKQPSRTIDAPIGRDRAHRHRMSTKTREGRHAVTHYKVRKAIDTPYGKFALLDVTIETGRTHQIRVHLSSIGHPVVGDTLYGAPEEIRPLAASRLRARPKDTKASRDRAATDLARQLTEQAMSGSRRTGKMKARAKMSAPVAQNLAMVSLTRNFLHAARLEFTHPKTGKPVAYESALPVGLEQFLVRLGGSR